MIKSGLVVVLAFAVFVEIKEASAQCIKIKVHDTTYIIDTLMFPSELYKVKILPKLTQKQLRNMNRHDNGPKDTKDQFGPAFSSGQVAKIVEYEPYSFASVDILPSFPGGEEALVSYLHKNIAGEKGIKGRAIVSFIVERDGLLTQIEMVRGLDKKINREIVIALKRSPIWKPGLKNDNIVSVRYTMPVNVNYKL